MKIAKHWKMITGSIIIIGVLYSLFVLINHRPEILNQLVAQIVTMICWAGLGITLIYLYIKDKDKEDAGIVHTIYAANSPEDIEILKTRRNKIIASIFLIEIFSSLSGWITNNYYAGFTQHNVETIFDIFIHFAIVYFVFALYKNKPLLKYLLYVMIVSLVGYVSIAVWEKTWVGVMVNILFVGYIVYYILSPVNRRNYRIANFIILPLVALVPIIYLSISGAKISELTKKEQQQEQIFADSSLKVISSYTALVQESDSSKYRFETEALDNALDDKHEKIGDLSKTLENLKSEILKEPTNKDNENFKQQLENIEMLKGVLALHETFDDKMQAMSDLIKAVDIENVSEEQQTRYTQITVEVLDAQKKVQDASKALVPDK